MKRLYSAPNWHRANDALIRYTRPDLGSDWRLRVSESDPIRVFVTHTFQENIDYLRVFEFLESMDSFF